MESAKIKFPSPLTIALMLTAFVFVASLGIKIQAGNSIGESLNLLILGWYDGLWDNSAGGLYFAFQMMLILVLGHVLALTTPFRKIITSLTQFCNTSAQAAVVISVTAILLGYLNWGLALVLSALLVKHVLLKFQRENTKTNIGLLGAAAYSSMLVWHGGLSGSSPTKASEENAIREMLIHAGYPVNSDFPSVFKTSETLFSTLNITVFIALLILIPLLLYFMAKRNQHKETAIDIKNNEQDYNHQFKWNFTVITGAVLLFVAGFVAIKNISSPSGFLNINFINLSLLGLGILLHNNFERFTLAVSSAIQDASGILIQFPIYFGIIGLMKSSGLTVLISDSLVDMASTTTLPILSFLSAGLLNFFIPSGGGQFYIQGPMLIQSAIELGVSIPKIIMALSYGDQWTNMLQPFWALPLLGITKIKLSQLLPYCLALFALSGLVFMGGLMLIK